MKKILIAFILVLSVSAAHAKTMVLKSVDPNAQTQLLILNDNTTFVAKLKGNDTLTGEWKISNGELHLRANGSDSWVWTACKSDGKTFSIYDTSKHDFVNFKIGYSHE